MPTHHYFKHGRHTCSGLVATSCPACTKKDATPAAPRLPTHHIVMAKKVETDGHITYRAMSRGQAGNVLGGQKGGRQAWVNGTAHRFTSESARKAARRRWDHHHKVNTRIGVRLGMTSTRRPAVDHKALRRQYALEPGFDSLGPIWYNPRLQIWQSDDFGRGNKRISERTALIRLGHLKKRSRGPFIPDSVKPVYRGTKHAKQGDVSIVGAVRAYRPGGQRP